MSTFILCLIAVCLITGIIERATAGYRRVMRNERARNRRRWPREQHYSFFRDLKRLPSHEDMQ